MDILQYCKYCWFWFSNLSNLHQLINVIQCIKYKTFLHFEKVIKVNYILLKWGEIMQVTSISLLKYLILFLLSLCILVFIKNAYKTLLVVLCHYLHVEKWKRTGTLILSIGSLRFLWFLRWVLVSHTISPEADAQTGVCGQDLRLCCWWKQWDNCSHSLLFWFIYLNQAVWGITGSKWLFLLIMKCEEKDIVVGSMQWTSKQ